MASVFCALHLRQFTGVIFVDSDEHQGVFSFRDGNPVFVELEHEPPIADYFLERGLVDDRQYTEIAALGAESVEKSEDVAFCERAVQLGVLSREQVDSEMSRRVRGRVIEAVVWEGCRIEVDESRESLVGIREYPQPLGPLVYMGVRTFYEEAQVRSLLGDLDALYLRVTRPLRKIAEFFDFDMQERALVGRFEPEVPVANTVDASSFDALEAWQIVCMLGLAGMAELSSVPFSSAPEPSGIRDRLPAEIERDRAGRVSSALGDRRRVSTGRMPVVREEVGRKTVDRMPVAEDPAKARAPGATSPPGRRPIDAFAPTQRATPTHAPPGSVRAPAVREEVVGRRTADRIPAVREEIVDRRTIDRMPAVREEVVDRRTADRVPASAVPPRSTAPERGSRPAFPPAPSQGDEGPTVPFSHPLDARGTRPPPSRVPARTSPPPVPPTARPPSRPRVKSRTSAAASRLGRELRHRRPHEPSSPPPTSQSQSGADYAHVKQLLQRRRVAERVKEEERDASASMYAHAIELLRDQHFSRALQILEGLCAAEPQNQAFQMYRMWSELRSGGAIEQGARDALRKLCRERLENDDHKSFAHYALGYMSLQDGKEDVALRHFRKAVAADRGNTNAERHLRILERRREATKEK